MKEPANTLGEQFSEQVAATSDITPEENLNGFIRKCERVFDVFSSMEDMIFVVDSRDRLVYFNRAMCSGFNLDFQRRDDYYLKLASEVGIAGNGKRSLAYRALQEGKKLVVREYIDSPAVRRPFHAVIEAIPYEVDGEKVGIGIIKDVSNVVEKDEELRNLLEYVQNVFRNVPEPAYILVLDEEGKITYVNDALVNLLGIESVDVAINRRPSELFRVPEGKKTIGEMVVEKRKPILNKLVITETYEGRKIPTLVSSVPIYDSSGNFRGSLGVMVDISEQKRKEEDVKRTLKLVSEIFKNLPEYVIFVGTDGRIKYTNLKTAKLAGFDSVDELIGKKPTEVAKIHEDHVHKASEYMSAIKNRRVLEGYEVKLRGLNGETVYVSASIYPVYIDGEFVGYVETFADVTSIKEREREMREIIDKIPVPLFVLDRNHRVSYWNKAVEELTGYPAGEIVGTNSQWKPFYDHERPVLADIVMENPEDAHKLYSKVEKHSIISGAYYAEGSFVFNGRETYLHFTAAPLYNDEGKVIGAVETLVDLTDLKNREKDIQELLDYTRKNLEKFSEAFTRLSNGDLDVRLEKEKDDEFGRTVDVFNGFVERLKGIITKIVGDMNVTKEHVKEVAEAVSQMNAGMQQISSASQQIAQGAENLSNLANNSVAELRSTREIFANLDAKAKESREYAVNASENAIKSREVGARAIERLGDIIDGIKQTRDIVEELNNAVKNIGKVTEKIKSIADQTNLLALNAAIEAARAGEHGRGFAVVADEVRKLAEESRRSTEEINEIVRSVLDETQRVTDAVKKTYEQAEMGSQEVLSALNRSKEIARMVNDINERLGRIVEEADEGLRRVEQIAKNIEEVASTAEESAASAEETSAAIEEQTAAVQQISASAEQTVKSAERTLKMIEERFSL